MRQPESVSEVIAGGSGGFIGILRDSPACVLKFCSPENLDAVECLQRETEILGTLGHHKHIARLEAVRDDGLSFVYYPFGSIRDYYQSLDNNLPPLQDRFRWCHQCIAGIAYIHSKNILHNDISARNVLLSPDMTIKICDFGFSTFGRIAGVLGRTETRYERPSTSRYTDASPLDDLFAVGSLLFEILSGKRPYDDVDSGTIEQRYKSHEFPSLDSIDRNYAKIINKCWNEQYSCIEEIEDELQLLIKGSSSTTIRSR
jgi:serine/threonine protein kinase